MKKIIIKPKIDKSLQEQITEALDCGANRVLLDGHFTPKQTVLFSFINLSKNIELIGINGATLDGQQKTNHLIFIEDYISVKITGIRLVGGNTGLTNTQISRINHPLKKLNIFRYLDGGAICIGSGSKLLIENCELVGNHSAVCGGAISNLGGDLHVVNCMFEENTCGDTGAAVDNLAVGSLTVIENSRFINNKANLLGYGNHGAVTVFPDTYLIVKNSDFSREPFTAIDYRPNKFGNSFDFIDQENKYNNKVTNPVVMNPQNNWKTLIEIVVRFLRLFLIHSNYIKLEGLPTTNIYVKEKHLELYKVQLPFKQPDRLFRLTDSSS